MAKKKAKRPRCIVIAGPNGAGKTTLARELLGNAASAIRFVNADLLAAGLSPLQPESAAVQAGKLLLSEIDRLAKARNDFAFETTLSGKGHAKRLLELKKQGYHVTIIFIQRNSPRLAVRRVESRVRQGGHGVPKADILRRFDRGLRNFSETYRLIADAWVVYDNSGEYPRLLESGS